MELSYVLHAAKRYWKVVMACALLGAVFGYLQLAAPAYTSRATISVSAGSDAAAGDTPDRHVATQIGVLTSQEFAAKVAKRLGQGLTARALLADVTVSQQSGTDLVDIIARDANGSRARAIAGAYATQYATDVTDTGLKHRDAVTRRYDGRLATARDDLARVDASIEITLAQYNATSGGAARPTIEEIKPDLASQRSVLLDQVTQLTNDRARALVGASGVSSARIIERGTDPRLEGKSSTMVLGMFTLAALFGGVFLSVVLARVSPRVLDGEEAAELVGAPLFGRLPAEFGTGMSDAGSTVGIDDAVFLNELCARVESTTRSGPALTALVVGTEHVADSSSLARALAATLEARGVSTFCADIDVRKVDEFAPIPAQPTLLRVTTENGRDATSGPTGASSRPTLVTKVADVSAAFVREHGPKVALETMSAGRDVVIVAAGSLLEAPASAEFADLVDLVVVVVPTHLQTRRRLQIIAQQLAHRSGPVLVVEDGRDHLAGRRSRRFSMPTRPQAGNSFAAVAAADRDHESGDDDEQQLDHADVGVAKARAESRRGLG